MRADAIGASSAPCVGARSRPLLAPDEPRGRAAGRGARHARARRRARTAPRASELRARRGPRARRGRRALASIQLLKSLSSNARAHPSPGGIARAHARAEERTPRWGHAAPSASGARRPHTSRAAARKRVPRFLVACCGRPWRPAGVTRCGAEARANTHHRRRPRAAAENRVAPQHTSRHASAPAAARTRRGRARGDAVDDLVNAPFQGRFRAANDARARPRAKTPRSCPRARRGERRRHARRVRTSTLAALVRPGDESARPPTDENFRPTPRRSRPQFERIILRCKASASPRRRRPRRARALRARRGEHHTPRGASPSARAARPSPAPPPPPRPRRPARSLASGRAA